MKKIWKQLALILVGIIFLIGALHSFITARINVFGNPSFEKFIQQCHISNNGIVRFYIGDGGATTSQWFTVTYQKDNEREQQIFYSYGDPFIESLVCKQDSVSLSVSDKSPIILPQDKIERELIRHPIGFYYSKAIVSQHPPFPIELFLGIFSFVLDHLLGTVGFVLGLVMVLVGVVSLVRNNKNKK